ncbi:MAG TPA: hypothetical protein DEF05_10700, partial [Erwinia sp.]|nr:hypothetical protein [Erwinia sp.]
MAGLHDTAAYFLKKAKRHERNGKTLGDLDVTKRERKEADRVKTIKQVKAGNAGNAGNADNADN